MAQNKIIFADIFSHGCLGKLSLTFYHFCKRPYPVSVHKLGEIGQFQGFLCTIKNSQFLAYSHIWWYFAKNVSGIAKKQYQRDSQLYPKFLTVKKFFQKNHFFKKIFFKIFFQNFEVQYLRNPLFGKPQILHKFQVGLKLNTPKI